MGDTHFMVLLTTTEGLDMPYKVSFRVNEDFTRARFYVHAPGANSRTPSIASGRIACAFENGRWYPTMEMMSVPGIAFKDVWRDRIMAEFVVWFWQVYRVD